MTIGERRERIEIKRKARTERDDGGYDTSIVTISTRWAKITPQRRPGNTEIEVAGSLRGTVRYDIEIDSRGADVRTDDLIVWKTNDSLVLNVRDVRTSSRRALPIEIVAELGVPNSGA
jgi:head-tail adaptor